MALESQDYLDTLVTQAVFGDQTALEQILDLIHQPIYNLSLRMLRYPEDAEDASQEILIKVVTHMSSFQHKSAFMTWVFKVASNHLLTARKKNSKHPQRSFEEIQERLRYSLSLYEPSPEIRYEDKLFKEEIKRSCTLGMLRALSAKQRMALILGEIYELKSQEAAYIMQISPEAYRKQLSRARQDLVGFMLKQCGLVAPERPCRCHKHIQTGLKLGELQPNKLLYAEQTDPKSQENMLKLKQKDLAQHRKAAALLKSHPSYKPNQDVLDKIKTLVFRS